MYEPYNLYSPYSPYFNYNQSFQNQQMPKQPQQMYKSQNMITLQGKVVDSLDVVKAADIPYDGSVSYFPLTDGTAIITKQLQQDGTSKVVIYKPMIENEENKNKYITENDLEKKLKNMDSKFITGDDLKDQLKNVNSKDIKDLKEDVKTLKRKLEDIADDLKYKKEK
jgi:pyruvate/2-oxoacid:ferredoxin oxidoreductase beta subunit